MEEAKNYYNLGSAHYFSGQYNRAAKYLQRAIDLDPTFSVALNQIGVVYADIGQYQIVRALDEKAGQHFIRRSFGAE